MFADVLNDFDGRVAEVDLYFRMLAGIDNDEISIVTGAGPQVVVPGPPPPDWGRMLKGAAYLVLYNLVEAFIRRGFQEMFECIKADALSATKLTQMLREQWIMQKNRRVKAFDGSPKVYMGIANTIVTEIVANTTVELHHDHLPISGNLDADIIREVCRQHGVPHITPPAAKGGVELAAVKTRRNALAHGNESFVDCGRLLTAGDLERVKVEVVLFVRSILLNLEQFATNGDYET
jgi:hypothetical protein